MQYFLKIFILFANLGNATYIQPKQLYDSVGWRALAYATQSTCGCPIPEGVQSQTEWGLGQIEVVAGNPACGTWN